ncbi:MAG: very short patch repair endonuclease [Deltaproteobacteria bacterium]|nr:very short patch repair endonuclease [Deltaproteobacteria bacterium]
MTASARVEASTPDARRRMQRVRQKDTSAESALRRELHARGIRYRVQVPVLTKPRRVADVAFGGLRVAVFVDGCFWHGCPAHATWPKQNAEFWRAKIETNMARDHDTDERLRVDGWKVIRVWAHEDPKLAARRIAQILERRRERLHRA